MEFGQDKKQLRKQLLASRQNLRNHAQHSLYLQRVLRTWLVGRADLQIGAYWPIKKEFDPLPALARWQEELTLTERRPRGESTPLHPIQFVNSQPMALENMLTPQRSIGLPVVDKVTKTLQFLSWYPGCPMVEDAYDILKPDGTPAVQPTLLFVPCVGYGPGGYRIGYGGGFYDRTLAQIKPKPYTVGLAFSNAFVPNFLPESHDIPLDCILTEQGQVWP